MSRRRGILYEAYMFRGKDPAIDEFRTVVQDANGGKLNHRILQQIHENGGPTTGATRGWFFGDTFCPRNATLEAAGRALGMKRIWVRDNNPSRRSHRRSK
jgi:hypothetical protein